MNYKLIAAIGVIGATYAVMTGLVGVPFLGSETAFTPEKTFVYDSQESEGGLWVYATGENSTHWKGTMASNSSYSDLSYQKFIVNKETLEGRMTDELSRSQLERDDLRYSERQTSLGVLFPPLLAQTEEQREKMTEPGTITVESSTVEISETEYNDWKAYKYEITSGGSSAVYYASRNRPNILLGVEGGGMTSFSLEEVESGINYP